MTDMERLAAAGLFSRKVPRYTSYPTAPMFHDGIGPDTYARWLGALPAGSQLSVYVHIPFCIRLCWFCACRTQGVQSLDPVRSYLRSLMREFEMVAAHLPAGVSVARIHWGGGTPTILPPDLITELASAIRQNLQMAADPDFSVEIDPTCADPDKIAALAESGLTRASIGVQDFDPLVQKTIGREQGFEVTRDIVEELRAAGVGSVNIDMVYGLPYQTPERFARTLDMTRALSPDRIALFGYAHVPWMAKRQKMIPEAALPGPEARLALFRQAEAAFLADGHIALGIDHFARPQDSLAVAAANGRMKRNFQGYTDDLCTALIGFGASSIGNLPQGFVQNVSATMGYHKAIEAGDLPVAKGLAFTLEDRVRGRAIETLMCDFEIDRAALAATFGDMAALIDSDLAALAESYTGFVVDDGTCFRVTPEGRPLTRIIAAGLDAYQNGTARHSQAV
ncbi:oxygen-independent coproporphyrinogen III oxidase [Oceanomicrobium pacificus]|uniref:Coproporphyrinogen-III oxidase n=1 Tax=Oceanomicrobium pacificus TaxID=2692916 RepID=A0A6B0TS56_9RHOB|nr:oxygen-independent coproporphyrinogen III oxidase [Oceanomicrobium pacificus]MXU65569.1 oxygen-independent coproporphyrinogen III oxidase [Oceanomicrobium pacificus]